ncbi:MAG: hypothetical protein K8U57_10200 [Planctomycetes bacterium]|nr:hypothetical protein [Planctomycetota bacterium]
MTAIFRLVIALGVVFCVGCGGESKVQLERKRDLMHIVLAYHNFFGGKDRGPHSAEELVAFEDIAAKATPANAESESQAKKALQSGNYVLIWDVTLESQGELNKGKILGYHRDVPEKGGAVCFQDGMVKILTREEFERTPKSQPSAAGK